MALMSWSASSIATNIKDTALKTIKNAAAGNTRSGTSTDPNLKNVNYTVMIVQQQDLNTGSRNPKIVVGAVPPEFQITQDVKFSAPFGSGLMGDSTLGNLMAMMGNRLVAQVMTMQVWQGAGDDSTFTITFELRAYSDTEQDVHTPLRRLLEMSMPSVADDGFLYSPGPILDPGAMKAIGGTITSVGIQVARTGANFISRQASEQFTAIKDSLFGSSKSTTKDGNNTLVQDFENTKSTLQGIIKSSGITSKHLIQGYLKNRISISIGRWFYLDNIVITNVQHNLKPQTVNGKSGQLQAATVTVSFKPMFLLTAEDIEFMLRQAPKDFSLSPPPSSLYPEP